MDLLNNFFETNKNFDLYEPKTGHQNRFEKKLAQSKIHKKNNRRIFYWAVASVLVVSLSLAGISYRYNKQRDLLAIISPEMKKSSDYFTMIIKEEIKEIKQNETPETKKVVSQTMQQLKFLENDYNKLVEDFKQNNDNKLIINAMIDNFRKRIKLLEFTKKQLEEIKNFKHNNYEQGKI